MTQVLNRSAHAGMTGYIVRAGTDPRMGMSEEVRRRFRTERAARKAFLALRLSPAYRHGWAELVAVGDGRTPMPLCWFGDRSPSTRAVQVEHQRGTLLTKGRERIAASPTDLDRRRIRRSRLVAALMGLRTIRNGRDMS